MLKYIFGLLSVIALTASIAIAYLKSNSKLVAGDCIEQKLTLSGVNYIMYFKVLGVTDKEYLIQRKSLDEYRDYATVHLIQRSALDGYSEIVSSDYCKGM